jgi:asparagine synthase (glutamine-hydrolysing)
MSGVCAVARFDGGTVDQAVLDPMLAAAPYRGQDGVGSWIGSGIGLAQQLLRATGDEVAEPVIDGHLVIVADARLDNRRELLAALRDTDAGCTDAELVVAAYRRWGRDFATRLIGDFAVVIWDDRARRMVAARDPMAMRMLAYHHSPRRVVVATEVKQVLTGPEVPVRLDEGHVGADLINHFGLPTWSAYEDVHVLAPGHVLEVDADGVRTWSFWTPDPDRRLNHQRPEEYAEHLRALFMEATSARMRTDRGVGVLLSGGVDSGSVASTAGWLLERGVAPTNRVHTCTFVFDDLTECDERDVARSIVDAYRFEHTEVVADQLWPLRGFPAHGPPRDEPFVGAFQPLIDAGQAALRAAGVRVVLSGDRGDLLIGPMGFRYLPLAQQRRWTDLRHELVEHHEATGDPISALVWRNLLFPATVRARRRISRWRPQKERPPTAAAGSPLRPNEALPPWVRHDFAARHDLAALLGSQPSVPAGFGPSRTLRYTYILTQMHIRGMAASERSAAQHGLVFADPFSDRRLTEFVLSIPQAAIIPTIAPSKPLMRAAMRGIMPQSALQRADKVIPKPLFDRGLLHEGTDTVRWLLDDMQLERRAWIDERLLHETYERSTHGAPLPAAFWSALVTEWWLRTYGA